MELRKERMVTYTPPGYRRCAVEQRPAKEKKQQHPLRPTWASMIARCHNRRAPNYKWYGGRGIAVCDRWQRSFEHFLADVGERPSPERSLDRYPDTDGNYEPSNIRWATRKEQAANKKGTRLVTVNGRKRSLKEVARELGIPTSTAYDRRNKGWSLDRVLETKKI